MALTAIGRSSQTPANQSAGAQQQSADDAKDAEFKQASEERMRQAREILATRDPEVTSQVSGITILSVQMCLNEPLFPHGAVYVKYRNDTGKTITAYDERVPERSSGSRDLINPVVDQTWHDGGIVQEWHAIQPGGETVEVVMLAVIYDDGSADGVGDSIQKLRDYRLGKKLLFLREANILEGALKGPDSDLAGSISLIIRDEAAASEEREKGLPGDTVSRMRAERGSFLRAVQDLVENPGLIGRRMFLNGQPAQFTLRTVLTEFTRRLSQSADSM